MRIESKKYIADRGLSVEEFKFLKNIKLDDLPGTHGSLLRLDTRSGTVPKVSAYESNLKIHRVHVSLPMSFSPSDYKVCAARHEYKDSSPRPRVCVCVCVCVPLSSLTVSLKTHMSP